MKWVIGVAGVSKWTQSQKSRRETALSCSSYFTSLSLSFYNSVSLTKEWKWWEGNNQHLYMTGCFKNKMGECTKQLAKYLALGTSVQYVFIIITQMLYAYCPKSIDSCSSLY